MYKSRGLSLIELVVALAIVGILAAIVTPAYVETTNKTKRRDAGALLTQFAQAMERYYAVQYTYEGAAAEGENTGSPAASTFRIVQSPKDGVASYSLTISAASPTDFTLSATPVGAHVDDACGVLTLDSSGLRGYAEGAQGCW